jgi:hypothetical protein
MAGNSEVQKSSMGHGVKQKFVRQLLILLLTVWQSYSPDRKGGPSVDWSSLGSTLMNYRDRVDLSADTKTAFKKLERVLGIKWYVCLSELGSCYFAQHITCYGKGEIRNAYKFIVRKPYGRDHMVWIRR